MASTRRRATTARASPSSIPAPSADHAPPADLAPPADAGTTSDVHLIDTPRGMARVTLGEPPWDVAVRGLLVLGHGAGGSIGAPDLVALARYAPARGILVARVEQPYRVAGRRAPAPAAHLDEAWIAVLDALPALVPAGAARDADGLRTAAAPGRPAQEGRGGLPVVAGGRSSGARVAARTSAATGVIGVLALSFPLIDPRGQSRAGELDGVDVPVLVVQGDRDRFGMPESRPGRHVHVVPGGDHSLRGAAARVVAVTLPWLDVLLDAGGGARPPAAEKRAD